MLCRGYFCNKRPAFTVIACIGLFALAAVGQNSPEPVLVDSFSPSLNCEDLLARTDALSVEMRKVPGSRIAVVIGAPSVEVRPVDRTRRLVSSTLELRGLEMSDFSIYFVRTDGLKVSYWIVPPGASEPVGEGSLLVEPPPDLSRPFIFGVEDEINICPTFVPKAFAKLLRENDGSRGHIVVREGSDKLIDKFHFAESFINELVNKQGIPRNRLRLFFAKGTGFTTVEFWFVPAKRK